MRALSAACTYTPEIPGFLSRFLGNVGILASTAACEELRFAGGRTRCALSKPPEIITDQGKDSNFYKANSPMLLKPSPVLPPLSPEEYGALRDHIACNGVEEPILVTSEGIIIDGHERFKAVTELGIRKYPIRVVGNLSEKERREMAISLNLLRRHLSRSERQHSLEELIGFNPQISSRDLAATAKVSQSTAARAKAKVLGTESNDSVEVVGSNGKTYTYKPKPAVSVETPQSAKKAAKLLESLGDKAPEGGIDLRKAQKLTRLRLRPTSLATIDDDHSG